MTPELFSNPQFTAALLIGFGAFLALTAVIVGGLVRGGDNVSPPPVVLPPIVVPSIPQVPVEPQPEPTPPPTLVVSGKISTFGGPDDHGSGDPEEELALYQEAQALARPDLFLSVGDGLFRRQNPDAFYVACRWDYKVTSKAWLRDHKAKVTKTVGGKKVGSTIEVSPTDWGPRLDTGRAIDLSPGAAAALGLKTDDMAVLELLLPPTAALPQDRPGGASWLARAVALRGLYEKSGDTDNPAILEMARICGGQIAKTYKHDSIAWCALFVNYCLIASKYPGNDSLWALDFGKYGRRLSGPAVGAIASKKRDGGGHVFFVLGRAPSGQLVGIGGNQGDMVCDDTFNPTEIVSYNWPEDAPVPLKVGVSMSDLSALQSITPAPKAKQEVRL